jgi:pyochelin biosynthesis protein PchC
MSRTGWLRSIGGLIGGATGTTRHPALRVVCCPHAGGHAGFFASWGGPPGLGADVQVLAVQYPGRADRVTEPPAESMEALADGLAAALEPLMAEPLVLFGHSLGSLVAYETARRLPRPPARLIVSGRAGPQLTPSTSIHRSADHVIVDELVRLGGTAASLLADPEAQEVFLPAVRADYRVSETYSWTPGPPLRCGLTVVVGDADPEVGPDQVWGWTEVVADPRPAVHVLPGGHFMLIPRRDEVLALLHSDIAPLRRPSPVSHSLLARSTLSAPPPSP